MNGSKDGYERVHEWGRGYARMRLLADKRERKCCQQRLLFHGINVQCFLLDAERSVSCDQSEQHLIPPN